MRKQIPLATVDSHLNLKGWWKYLETKQKKGGTDQTDLWCEMESQQQNSDDCDAQFLHDG